MSKPFPGESSQQSFPVTILEKLLNELMQLWTVPRPRSLPYQLCDSLPEFPLQMIAVSGFDRKQNNRGWWLEHETGSGTSIRSWRMGSACRRTVMAAITMWQLSTTFCGEAALTQAAKLLMKKTSLRYHHNDVQAAVTGCSSFSIRRGATTSTVRRRSWPRCRFLPAGSR